MRLPRFLAQSVIALAMLPIYFTRFRLRFGFWLNRTICMSRVRWSWVDPRHQCSVSVITPTYKRLSQLAEAIDSVLAQSFQDWEQIIVADGHDPDVEALVASYGDPRLRYLPAPRFSSYGHFQRNVALANACGGLVIFLDDDNILYEDALDALAAAFDSHDIGFVVGPVRFDENMVLVSAPDFRVGEIDTLSFMVRRKLFARVGGWRNAYLADYLVIDAIRKIARGRYLASPVIGYHR